MLGTFVMLLVFTMYISFAMLTMVAHLESKKYDDPMVIVAKSILWPLLFARVCLKVIKDEV